MTTPGGGADGPYDPAARLRRLYSDADTALLELVAKAVADTIDQPAQQQLIEARLKRRTRELADQLMVAAANEIDHILDTALDEGAQRGQE